MSTNLFTIGLGGVIGDGTRLPLIAESEIMLLEKSLRKAESHLRIHSERGTMGYGWMKLPYADIEPLRLVARKLEDYDSIVQVGIGGRLLGTSC